MEFLWAELEIYNWKRHISLLNSKFARASFAINQVKNVLPQEILKTLYILYLALNKSHSNCGILREGGGAILAWGMHPYQLWLKQTYHAQ